MEYTAIEFSAHAVQRMFERRIDETVVVDVIRRGEVIAAYEEDQPYPSVLLLGMHEQMPVHVVAARQPESGIVRIITVYIPNTELWSSDYKTRNTP